MSKGNQKAKLNSAILELSKAVSTINKDPKLSEKAEEFVRKYGTLTEKDLEKRFTV